MSLRANDQLQIVIDEPTLMALTRLIGAVEASIGYTPSDPATADYLVRLREYAAKADKLFQFDSLNQ